MKKETEKKIWLGVGVLFVLTLLIGVSYALWMLTFQQETENVVNTGCFKIEFTEQNPIHLEKAYPITDQEGMKNTPYTFTIKNICNNSATFQINLESLVPSEKVLPDHYVKANISEGTSRKNTTKLVADIQTETTISGAVKAYKLYTGVLDPNETKEFNLRLWMDEDTPAVEESMDASYSGKVSVITSYYQDNRGMFKIVDYKETTKFWGYKDKIIKVVIEDKLNPMITELKWDVSSEGNGSVMSYLVRNEGEEELYTLYLQSDGGIKANPNSNYLFQDFTKLETIEGLEYFDTSRVTNLAGMFSGCRSLTSLDVSHFDTSKVTNMRFMFEGCSSLTSLDVSHFDTSNVTNMQLMFSGCSGLTSLNLSHFDTSNVILATALFSGCSSLTSLDVSHFDTSKMEVMSSMFAGCSGLTSIDVSHFETSKVVNMGSMFQNCSGLTNLDVSHFDTSNVTNISNLFGGCSSLISVDVSHFNTSNVTNMYGMFSGCSNLTSLNVSSFNTNSVTSMEDMFKSCQSLTSLDLSSFDTSNVTNMGFMFGICSNLTDLNISNFTIDKLTNMSRMFEGINVLSTVKVKDATMQNWVLTSENGHPSSWTTENVVIAV